MEVRDHLPAKLKDFFRDDQVVSFVVSNANQAGERNFLKECEMSIEVMAT